MRGYPNNDHWDCGGECIHGGLVGPGRDCDGCWEGTAISLVRDRDGARSAETACPARVPKDRQARAEGIAQTSPQGTP